MDELQDGAAELAAREQRALAMGGAAKVARQHKKGRLTARERIDLLLDPRSFDEVGLLAHSDLAESAAQTAADGKVTGFGRVDGQMVFVSADDVTVMAGAGGRVGVGKQFRWSARAAEKGYPCIHLGDAGGARVPDIMGSVGMMSMVYPLSAEPRARRVPLVTCIMGECYGGPTWTAAVSDIVIQVKGSIMAVGGPSILAVATGEQTPPEALGGWELHATTTGMVDLFAESEEACLWLTRRVLGYLPANHRQPPPVKDVVEPLRAIDDLVPQDGNRAYDMHAVLEAIVDGGSLLELKPHYDPSLITGLARLEGQTVGIIASNPQHNAGAMGAGACQKATSLIVLCDSYHIPIVFVHDTPGFLIGRDAERQGMARHIMMWIEALQLCSVPRLSVIVRKSYGMAHCNMSGGNMGNELLLAWPSAEISFVAPEVAVSIVYGRKLQQADEGEQQRLMEKLARANAPWPAAGRGLIDKVIAPQETRQQLIAGLQRARGANGDGQQSRRRMAGWPRLC